MPIAVSHMQVSTSHTPEHVYVSAAAVTAVEQGEAVVLNSATGTYFGLNETATYVWSLVAGGETSTARLVMQLAHAYAIPHEIASHDVLELTAELLSSGLLTEGRCEV